VSSIRRQLVLNALKLFDLGLMILSFGLATLAVANKYYAGTLEEFMAMRIKLGNFLIFAGCLLAWHMVLSSYHVYASHRLSRRRYELLDILKATSVGTLLIVLAAFMFHISMVTGTFVVVFWLSTTVLTMASRVGLRIVLEQMRLHGRNLRHMLIVGTNRRAVQFAKRIDATPSLGYRVVGFADQGWEGLEEFKQSGYPVVCDLSTLPDFLRSSVVDELVLALPVRSLHSHASEIAELCQDQGIVMRVFNAFDLKSGHSRVEEIDGHKFITHYRADFEGWQGIAKRAFDIAVSFVLLLLLAPALIVTAILIKLTSPGPVFFVQKRIGFNKRHISVYKFRTMVVDAEKRMKEIEHLNEVSGPVFKIKNDPRITAVGKFLRKTSIDELPQLFNVLKGDMSLVGPRPLPLRDYEGFDKDWQRRRFSVRPGITCLWQIAGRSSIPFEQWMVLDLQYIDKWSLWLDLQILVRTIPAVLRGSGAA
jgi:exopolysaccharide biosynthesis polyprenyl glycosylphosphotransferase